MRLFFVGIALLLTGSDVYGMEIRTFDAIKGTAMKPVKKLSVGGTEQTCAKIIIDVDGKGIQAGTYISASPDELKSSVCDPKHNDFKKRASVIFFHSGEDKAKDFLCCIHTKKVCTGTILVDSTGTRTTCKDNAGCGSPSHFCVMDKNNAEEVKKVAGSTEVNSDDWTDMGICCTKHTGNNACDIGTNLQSVTSDQCQAENGRCADNKGVCTYQGNGAKASSCCSQDEAKTCPGNTLPYSVNIGNNVYDFRLDKTFGGTGNVESCKKFFGGSKTFVLDGNLCCPKYKIQSTGTNSSFPLAKLKSMGDMLLPAGDSVNKKDFKDCSKNSCKPEEWCAPVEPHDNVQNGKLSLCFPKPTCPHPSNKVYPVKKVSGEDHTCQIESKECGDKSYCVSIDATNSTDWKIKSAVCCPRDEYDNPCSVDVGKNRNPLVDKTGTVIDVPGSNCTDDDKNTREWTPLNDGQGVSSHKVCCEWKKADKKVLDKFESDTCQSGGKLNIADGLFKTCPAGSADGAQCNNDKGKCRPLNGNSTVMACCIEEYCPKTTVPMSQVADCDSDNCAFHVVHNSVLKKKHCQMNRSNKSKCCMPTPTCVHQSGKEACGFNDLFPNSTMPIKLAYKCKDAADCGGLGRYCDMNSSHCYLVASNKAGRLLEGKECLKNEDCKQDDSSQLTFHCVLYKEKTTEPGSCLSFFTVAKKDHKVNTALVIGVIVLGVIGVIFLVAGVIMFLKYRSRNFCDTKKADKTKAKRGKDATTSDGTTGGTTEGETTGGK